MILFEKKNSPVKTLWLALLVCVLGLVWGCSADYDEFGESPYCDFDEIHFVGEAEGIQVFADEHKVIITLEERSDSLAAWDSVTIESIDISHMASLHLVESKIIEFPTDSAGLDSLAKVLAYSEKKLKKDSKIRIPASQNVYVMVVAEDGTPSLWQIQFVIPGVEPASNESSESEEKNDSNEGSESKDSSEQGNSKETSQNIIESSKSSERGLALQFVGQSRLDTLDDTLAVKFPLGTDVSKIAFESWSASDKASASPEPDKVTEWKTGTTITVTAEDGSTTKWYVRFSVAAATDVLSAVATGQTKSALIDESKGVVVLYLPNEAAKKKVDVNITLSEGATHDLSLSGLDLSSPVKFTVTASEDKREWTMSAEVFALPPRLESITVGAGQVKGVIDQESGRVFFGMDYKKDLDLRSLKVQSMNLSEGASVQDFKVGSSYNFSKVKTITIANELGDTKTYTLQAGYQYPGSDFNHWVADDFGNTNDIDGWDNGNNSALDKTKTLTVNEDKQIVKMESKDAKILGIGRFASGNMLVAYFNPKKVGTMDMTKYDDGNELIDFGRPFYARPKYVEFDVKYEGKGDSCDLYVLLENRSRTSNEGKNQYRTSSDVNTLVASAWYRATTVTSTDDPDVVSITDAARSGYKTIRLAFKYGEPDSRSPIYSSSVFTKALKNSAGIDNHLDKTTSPDSFDVTHIRVVMASSALGNLYKGTVGSTLWADEMRLIY